VPVTAVDCGTSMVYSQCVSIPFRPMTPTRLQAKGWARVGRPVPIAASRCLVPRGAHLASHIVVLDVNRRNVPWIGASSRSAIIPRALERRPVRAAGNTASGAPVPLTYAVCPAAATGKGLSRT